MDKFSDLLNRFDSYVQGAETGSMNDQALDRFEKLIERLEKIHYSSASGASQSTATSAQPAAAGAKAGVDFAAKFKEAAFKNVAALEEVTKQKGNEHLTSGINHYLELLRTQEAVLRTMAESKKPAGM